MLKLLLNLERAVTALADVVGCLCAKYQIIKIVFFFNTESVKKRANVIYYKS